MRKRASKPGHQVQKCQREMWLANWLRPAIFPSPHTTRSTKKQTKRMAVSAAPGSCLYPELDSAQDAVTRPILEAIDASKAAMMVSIDHLATE